MLKANQCGAAALLATLPTTAALADTLLAERVIDETGFSIAGPPYSAFFRVLVGEGSISLFTIPLDETSPGKTYAFESDADAVNFPFVVSALTDGIAQFANFRVFQSDGASTPIAIIGSEQDFFGLAETDLAGETISKIEFEVFDFLVEDIGQQTRNANIDGANFQVDFSGAIRVFGPGEDDGTVVPTPTAAALGLLGLVAVNARRRRA
ncbi:MAG: MYXO-CTERM sorting domain-containing protein [Planctomycetota bacterium]